MALNIPPDKQLRNPGQLLDSVKAVHGAGKETHWIEWKCGTTTA
jgi:hypothetical protein